MEGVGKGSGLDCELCGPRSVYLSHFQVSADEWEAIPDIGDYTIKKQPRMQVWMSIH